MSRLSSITRRAATFYGALIVAIAVAAWFAYSSIYGTSSSSASGVARTVTVTRGTVESSVSASGNVSAATSASPTFATSGTLTALTVAVGDRVRKGQVIAKIDATQAKATLASERANLTSARSALAAAEAGGTASQRAQNASSLSAAKLQLSSAQQTLAANQATLAAAKKQLAADLLLGCAAASSSNDSTGASPSASSASSSSSSTSDDSSAASSTPANGGATRTTQSLSTAAAAAPTATTGATGTVTTKAVTLTGTVDPKGVATTYVFQYGRKASFGSTTRTVSAGSGTSAVTATATIGGLKPATTYIYRLVAKNAEGTSAGLARTFTTATTSCSADRTAIASAERTVAQQKATVSQQQQAVASAQASIDSAVDAATVAKDAAQVTQAKLTVASAAKAVRETVLRAPISGTITAVNASVGDNVGGSSSSANGGANTGGGATDSSSASSGIVTIANLAKLEVVAGFAEADATKIKVGQDATVTLSALPNTTVAGKVTAVSPTSTVTSNVVTYDVTVALVDPSSSVRNGMTADVSVVVSRKTNVLELPSAAITTAGRASTVTILSGGEQTVTTVTTGLVGTSTTEILTGVKLGDVVVEPTVSVTASTSTSSNANRFGGGGVRRRTGRRRPSVSASVTHAAPAPAGAAPDSTVPVIELREVAKTYAIGDIEVHALRGVSVTVERGDFVAIMGASGSGKSTLMNIIGCLDVPSRGWYWLDGVDIRTLDERDLSRVRSRKIGFIFQSFNLIARTSALANVELPLAYMGVSARERRSRALAALESVGLSDRAAHVPSELSGGQQQRVAVARALVTNPALILADEPTGNLDSVASEDIMEIFDSVHRAGRTVVVITHEEDIAARTRRIVRLRDGQILSDTTQEPS